MNHILSRLLVRIAIVSASLAWAGFVFTHTIGDPGRGERIATAVLADPEARAEVVTPVSAAVMRSAGLPPELRPIVDAEVDRALRDPNGARAFVDPFAGSWARLLGQPDPRPTEFDLAPLLASFTATSGLDGFVVPERLPVPGVPLPRTQLGWMDGVRGAISAAVAPLALLAAGLFLLAFVIGDRARVLRRFGTWAMFAGSAWVLIPPLLVWAVRRWAPGADAVAGVALGEAIAGLVVPAIVLVLAGVTALVASFAVVPSASSAGSSSANHDRPSNRRSVPAAPPARRRTSPPTAEVPVVPVAAPVTTVMPEVRSSAPPPSAGQVVAGQVDGDEGDALWDFYSSGSSPR